MPFCQLPEPQPHGTQVLSIYDSNQDDYCLTNFGNKPEGDKYKFKDPVIGKEVECKNSEIFYQAQKFGDKADREAFIAFANKPGTSAGAARLAANNPSAYKLTNSKPALLSDDAEINIQLYINEEKAKQSPKVQAYLVYCGKNNIPIMEDTAGASYTDKKWGAGVDGLGDNVLGNALTATSKRYANPPATALDLKLNQGQQLHPNGVTTYPITVTGNSLAAERQAYNNVNTAWKSSVSKAYQLVAPAPPGGPMVAPGGPNTLLQTRPRVTVIPTPPHILAAGKHAGPLGPSKSTSKPAHGSASPAATTPPSSTAPITSNKPPRQAQPAKVDPTLKSIFADFKKVQDVSAHNPNEILDCLLTKKEVRTKTLDIYLTQAPTTKPSGFPVDAAKVVATCAVKNVMRDLNVDAQITMVDNNKTGAAASGKTHDNSAMRVQFNTPKEAQDFVKALYEQHGIHSHTFGQGYMKTPQGAKGNIVFLTKDDLNTIAKSSQISDTKEPGHLAYDVIKSEFIANKPVVAADDSYKPPSPGGSGTAH